MRENVSTQADALFTDEWIGYRGLSAEYPHHVIRHTHGEYVKGRTHTNTIEGFWSLFKRQVYGIHHWVSTKHLQRYVNEATWRAIIAAMQRRAVASTRCWRPPAVSVCATAN